MVPTWISSSGTLRITASATGFIGAVVVNIGGTTWDFYTGASQSTYPGHQIGVIIGPSSVIVQGNPVAVQTCGIIPPDYFNIGAGNAGTVIATGGSVLGRGSAGQVIGTADSSGNVTIYPSYVGSGGGLAGPVIGEIAGFALGTGVPGVGQAWLYDGARLTMQTVLTSLAGALTTGQLSSLVASSTYFPLPPNPPIGGNNTNTSQNSLSYMTMGTRQATVIGSNAYMDVRLSANTSNSVHVTYVVRGHGSVGVMAAGEIAACMYTDNTHATLVGTSHVIWSEDPGSNLVAVPTIAANYANQLAQVFVNIVSVVTYVYDIETVAVVVSN